jgi:methylmalonyl-CoA carboxyltransferase large subunit
MEVVENISIEALQEQVRTLQATVAALTARLDQIIPPPQPRVAAAAPAPVPEPVIEEGVSDEILVVLSAAIAAFLGKRARIRHARLVPQSGASAWAQQGRVFIQASHMLRH